MNTAKPLATKKHFRKRTLSEKTSFTNSRTTTPTPQEKEKTVFEESTESQEYEHLMQFV